MSHSIEQHCGFLELTPWDELLGRVGSTPYCGSSKVQYSQKLPTMFLGQISLHLTHRTRSKYTSQPTQPNSQFPLVRSLFGTWYISIFPDELSNSGHVQRVFSVMESSMGPYHACDLFIYKLFLPLTTSSDPGISFSFNHLDSMLWNTTIWPALFRSQFKR